MPTFQIICLANSDKYGGRCIAGLKTDGSGWLRPVSRRPDGELRFYNYILPDNREPELFEILEFDCIEPSPRHHQPENWILDTDKSWRTMGRASYSLISDILGQEFKHSADLGNLFGNESDRIDYGMIQQNPVEQSLAYIKPQDICWVVKDSPSGRKCRAIFRFNDIEYDFSITDPQWKSRLSPQNPNSLPSGEYSSHQVIDELGLTGFIPEGFRFTLSLGEPFSKTEGEPAYCYKLIAAVINIGCVSRLT